MQHHHAYCVMSHESCPFSSKSCHSLKSFYHEKFGKMSRSSGSLALPFFEDGGGKGQGVALTAPPPPQSISLFSWLEGKGREKQTTCHAWVRVDIRRIQRSKYMIVGRISVLFADIEITAEWHVMTDKYYGILINTCAMMRIVNSYK